MITEKKLVFSFRSMVNYIARQNFLAVPQHNVHWAASNANADGSFRPGNNFIFLFYHPLAVSPSHNALGCTECQRMTAFQARK